MCRSIIQTGCHLPDLLVFLHTQYDGQRYGSHLCYCEIYNISSTSIHTVRKMFTDNFEIEVTTEAIKGEDVVSADDGAAANEDPEEQARQIDPARAARC